VHTAGSTYQKPGALILIAANGDYAGLLSGGCLETDLREHATRVIASGETHTLQYEMGTQEDLLWGLGLGCEGTMRILLLRVGPQNDWQPLDFLAAAHRQHTPAAVGIVCESSRADLPCGALAFPASVAAPAAAALGTPALRAALAACARGQASAGVHVEDAFAVFLLPLSLSPRILVLGAGPDVVPLVEFAAQLSWQVTLVDHRPAYANAAHFPAAAAVLLGRPEGLAATVDLGAFVGAIVMSHHLPSDLLYLRALAASAIPYVGLLGPPARRDKLLTDLGALAAGLRPRLHAPIGLPLGGRAPESIALAIIAELHAFVYAQAEKRSAPSAVRAAGAH
jgi:xanthine/CO dehydrogenase XdhC/CoxF family maturation factor